jgi:transcriptional regulator with XRE-family HTH domain
MSEGTARNRHFAEQLARWRVDACLTQRQIAEHVGVTQQTVSDWERGVGLPHYTRLPALAGVLGLPLQTVLLTLHGQEVVGVGEDSDEVVLEALLRHDPEAHALVIGIARLLLDRARTVDQGPGEAGSAD